MNKIHEVDEKEYNYYADLLFNKLGIPETEGTEGTPARIAKMIPELFEGLYKDISYLNEQMTTFKAPRHSSPIEVKGIPFYSMCEHHMLPFFGFVDIVYTPRETILGLSKFNRIVKYFSRKPQVQERLTEEIAEYIFEVLQPENVKVVLRDCRHMCMEMRGVNQPSNTTTEILLESPSLISTPEEFKKSIARSRANIDRIRGEINGSRY